MKSILQVCLCEIANRSPKVCSFPSDWYQPVSKAGKSKVGMKYEIAKFNFKFKDTFIKNFERLC